MYSRHGHVDLTADGRDIQDLASRSSGSDQSAQSDVELLEIQRKVINLDDGSTSASRDYSTAPSPYPSTIPSPRERDVVNETLPPTTDADPPPIYEWNDDDLDFAAGLSRTTSASSSGNVPHAETSTHAQQLPDRKRARNSGDFRLSPSSAHIQKSRRPTPVPQTSGSNGNGRGAQHTSVHDVLGLLGSDDFEENERERIAAARYLEEREEQVRKDEEFARRLQESLNNTVDDRPASSYSTMNHSYSMPSFQRPQLLSPLSLVPQSFPYQGPSASTMRPGPSRSHFPPQRPTPSNFIDMTGDDDDYDVYIDRHIERRFPSGYGMPGSYPTQNFARPGMPNGRSQASPYGPGPNMMGSQSPPAMMIPGAYGTAHPFQATLDRIRGSLPYVSDRFNHLASQSASTLQAALSVPGAASSLGLDVTDPSMGLRHTSKAELEKLLQSIRPDADFDQNREGTPDDMKFPLLEHQKLGLSWMKAMEVGSNKGGILADDMGLGKTVQALALMVSRPSEDPLCKTNLIIAPVALIQQWKREIERLLKPGRSQLSIFIFHGEKKNTSFNTLKRFDVVLTTFGTLASESKRKQYADEMRRLHPETYQNVGADAFSLPLLGDNSKWYRVIIDEAQCIKNKSTVSAKACFALRSTYRWCMSGTPMMNSVAELFSLIHFLRIGPYNNLERFNMDFTRPLRHNDPRAMQKLQALLKAILLRRTKTSKIDGKPILQLPPRTTEQVHAAFSDDELEVYKALETNTQLQFNKYLRANAVGRNYSHILVLLLRLRQCCCHPHLIKDFSVDLNSNINAADLTENAKQFSGDVVVRIIENQDAECPVCIDAVENAIIFFPCGHSTCVECFARISDPSQGISQGQEGGFSIKCPHCRAAVDPKKVTDRASFKKIHCPEQVEEENEPEKAEDEDEDADSDTDSDDSDDSDADSLKDFIVKDDEDEENVGGSSSRTKKEKKKRKDRKGKAKADKKHKKTLAELKKEGMKNAKAKKKYINRLSKTWVTSAKIEKTLELLQQIQDRGEGEKTIIFSQFTSLLDLLEVPIAKKEWGYRRYDGSMKPPERNEAVLEFTDNPNCRIMLVSLKAGNAGLNLNVASQVIIFDPFWNPYIEEQAIDRAHRIGQMRPVMVHRILVPATVEDRILALQDKKREMIEGALDEKVSQRLGRLNTRDLAFLFGVPHQ